MDGTGVYAGVDPVKLMPLGGTDERDTYNNTWAEAGTASVSFGWDAFDNDGMVIGPFPKTEWSLNTAVITRETRGLDEFCIGTYDSNKNDIGCITLGIKKATDRWGGVQWEALDCTTYCQRYSDCGECVKDENCQFAPQNGGCVSKGAYIYDFGCPRPAFAPLTKIITRNEAAYYREAGRDDWESTAVLRVAMDRIDMTCPCDVQYRISATVYSEDMKPLHVINDVKPRLDHRHTFVDIPGMVNNTCYRIYSYICIAQGTLGRDDCSPAKIDPYCTNWAPNSSPPPSPPPFPPGVESTGFSLGPSVGGPGTSLGGDGGGITTDPALPTGIDPAYENEGKRWDPFSPPGREGQCPPPLAGPDYGNHFKYPDSNGLGR